MLFVVTLTDCYIKEIFEVFHFYVSQCMVLCSFLSKKFNTSTVMHMRFMFFAFLNNLKSSFSENNQPEHALDIFIENATKMFWFISLNAKMEIKH